MRRLIALAAQRPSTRRAARCSPTQRSICGVAAAFLFATLLVSPHWTGAQASNAHKSQAPPELKAAMGCLVAADFVRQYDLKYLKLKVGDRVWVRYKVGSIPGVGDTPGVFNIVVYSPDGLRGMLLFADPNNKGGLDAILNAYRLHRRGPKWSADYGNGGDMVYEAVGRFVTALSRSPRYRIRLEPGGSGCAAAGK